MEIGLPQPRLDGRRFCGSHLILIHVSTKTQNEENRAVNAVELLCAVCGLGMRPWPPRWGVYEGAVKADLARESDG